MTLERIIPVDQFHPVIADGKAFCTCCYCLADFWTLADEANEVCHKYRLVLEEVNGNKDLKYGNKDLKYGNKDLI